MRERVSLSTYLAARNWLLHEARCFRHWSETQPHLAAHYRGHLRRRQRQLRLLREAERVPDVTPFPFA